MNMIPTAAPYTMPSFDPSYFNYAAYPLNQMYQHPTTYCQDYSKSDSNSDESLVDGKGDHKLSPKYREKRIKNNEAAKKSRLNRKNREKKLQEENNGYKDTIHRQQKIIEDLQRQLEAARAAVAAASAAAAYQPESHFQEQIMSCEENKIVFRESTNQQSMMNIGIGQNDHNPYGNFKTL